MLSVFSTGEEDLAAPPIPTKKKERSNLRCSVTQKEDSRGGSELDLHFSIKEEGREISPPTTTAYY